MKGSLIVFTGLDGSGKSTLSRYLIETLNDHGIKSEYLWWYSAENSILRRTIRFCYGNNKTGNKVHKNEKLPGSSIIQSLYRFVVLLDYQRHTLMNVWLPLMRGRHIVCDRYVYDIVASFSLEFHYPSGKAKRLLRVINKLSPKPDVVFFVDVPAEVAVMRKDDIQSKKQHEKLRTIYHELVENTMIHLDGTRGLGDLKEVVWENACNHISKTGEN